MSRWRRRADRDAWLFLTPEVEREVPALVEDLELGPEAAERDRIERLVHGGSIGSWFGYLRECRRRLESADGADPEATRRLALVLREQYLLVPSLRPEQPDDRPELERLEELSWTSP